MKKEIAMQADKSSTEALEDEAQRNKADERAHKQNLREHPEDKSKTVRQTTPPGKGRSQ